jgi:hypothetical protein
MKGKTTTVSQHHVNQLWPRELWKELKILALELETDATDLTIQAVKAFLAAKRKERKKK